MYLVYVSHELLDNFVQFARKFDERDEELPKDFQYNQEVKIVVEQSNYSKHLKSIKKGIGVSVKYFYCSDIGKIKF